MRSTGLLAATAATALAALCLAVAAPGQPREASATAAAAAGAVSVTNSKAGQAIFTATGMRPGQVAAGRVRIGNGGDVAGVFSVAATGTTDTPGPLGGRLSDRLALELHEVAGARVLKLYSGTPAAMGYVPLGAFLPGEQREYELVAWMPDIAGDNLLQAASMSMGIEWRAVAMATPTPTPTPVVTVSPTPTPTPTPEPPIVTIEVVELDPDEAGLPSASSCLPRRKVRFRLRRPKGVALVKAVVRVNRRRAGRAHHRRRITVNLRHVRTPRAKIRVRIWASDGRVYVVKRKYRMCR
jgi:hypothetical protein